MKENADLPNLLSDKIQQNIYWDKEHKYQIIKVFIKITKREYRNLFARIERLIPTNAVVKVKQIFYDCNTDSTYQEGYLYLRTEPIEYDNYSTNIKDFIQLYGKLTSKGYYLTKVDQRFIGYTSNKKKRLVVANFWSISQQEKYKTVMDQFIQQQLTHMIFPNEKTDDYKSIIKKYLNHDPYLMLDELMKNRKYTKIYKQYIEKNYNVQDFIDFDKPQKYEYYVPVSPPPATKPDTKEQGTQYVEDTIPQPNLRTIERLITYQDDYNAEKKSYHDEPSQQQEQMEEQIMENMEYAGMAKVNHDFEKVILPPVINDSDELFKEFLLTNGEDKIYFNSKEKSKKEEPKEKEEDKDDEVFIPGLVIDQSKKIFSKTSNEEKLEYKMNEQAPDYLIKLFLSFYYNYTLSSFIIESREKNKCTFKIVPQPEQINTILAQQYFEQFKLYSDIFYKYCPETSKITLMINKIYKEYEIENNITNYKEIFDSTHTAYQYSHCIMCYYNEYFKGNQGFSNKSFSNFPYKGLDSIGFLLSYNNVIQCQVVQYDRFYCIDVYHENDKIYQISEGYDLPIKIKKLITKKYVCIINFNEVYDFIHNFLFLQPRKQSNTQYVIRICDKVLHLQLRHGNIQCKGKFDTPEESIIYFTIIKNIGNYTISENQNTTLSDLQLVSPIYFGKSIYGDYEKQLENMNKRPQLKVQQLYKGGVKKQQLTIYNKDISDDWYKKQQDYFNKNGIDFYVLDSKQSYMTFICPEQFQNIYASYINIPSQSSILYIGCQSSQISFNSINLYEIYNSYIKLLKDDYKDYVEYLRKSLFGRILINPIKYSDYFSITPGRCVRLMNDLLGYFDPKLICLKLLHLPNKLSLDLEWLQSVISINIKEYLNQGKYIIYHYKQKIFTVDYFVPKQVQDRLVFLNYDYNQYFYRDEQNYMYLLLNPELKDDKYDPYLYDYQADNNKSIKADYYDKCKQHIVTQDGILPLYLFGGYSIQKESFKEEWPSSSLLFKKYIIKDEIVSYLVDDKCENLIGFEIENDRRIYCKKEPLSKWLHNNDDEEVIPCFIDQYPGKDTQVLNVNDVRVIPYNHTIGDAIRVLITNNRQLFKTEHDFKKIRKQLQYKSISEKDDIYKRGYYNMIYGNMILSQNFLLTEKEVDEALSYIEQNLPKEQEQLESYIDLTNCYLTYTTEFNYVKNKEQILQISSYLQQVDDIYL